MSTPTPPAQWSELLAKAIKEPGTLAQAYRAFHHYSIGNQLLALMQCEMRGVPPSPIAAYNRWRELGRQVRRGERALTLCVPQTAKVRREEPPEGHEVGEDPEERVIVRFAFLPRFFLLSQTDAIPGAQPFEAEEPPALDWSRARALAALDITEETFSLLTGNCGGYAKHRDAADAPKVIAVNPAWPEPVRVTVHEVAHHLHGHTLEATMTDTPATPRSLREVEAEGTALLVCESLGIAGAEHSRAYMQEWYGAGNPIPETSARRIIAAADRILKAGLPKATDEEAQ